MPASVVARTGANRLRTKTRSRTRLGSTAARAALRSLPTNSGQDTRTSPLLHSPCLDLCQRELHVIRSIGSSLCKCTTRQGRVDVSPVHLIAAIAAIRRPVALATRASIRFLLHIAAGGRLDHAEVGVAGLSRRGNGAAGVTFHPGVPIRPPASRIFVSPFKPALRVAIQIVVEPMAALLAGGRIDDAGDVTAGGQNEARIPSHEILRAVRALPRHYVVLARSQHIEWYVDLRQVDRQPALRGLAGLLDLVIEIGVARIPAIHRTRQADAVGIPVQEVECLGRRALQVAVDDIAP